MTGISKILAVFIAAINFFLNLFGLPMKTSTAVDMSKFEPTPIFCDEFDGDTLDLTKWKPTYTHIRRGGVWTGKTTTVEDGALHMRTLYLEDGIDGFGPGWYSGSIETNGLFDNNYGYYEARCILPAGYGLWSAFWIFGHHVGDIDGTGIDGAEIDIMESAFWSNEKLRNTTQNTIHFDGYGEEHRQKGLGNFKIDGDPYTEYHTYGLEWNEDGYTFYIDGKMTAHTDFGGACKDKQYMILSVEVGGDDGVPGESWAGPSIEKNGKDYVGDFIVDYVKVYKYK